MDVPKVKLVQGKSETDTEFKARVRLAEEAAKKRARMTSGFKATKVDMWVTILDALRSYQSEFKMHEEIRVDLKKSPDKLRAFEKAKPKEMATFKKKRPMAYLEIVRDAAKRDPSILEGREKELVGSKDSAEAEQMHLFLQLIDEVSTDQTGAIRYYPDRLKRIADWVVVKNDRKEQFPKQGKKIAGLPHYRAEVAEQVKRDPTLLSHVISEYQKYWKRDVKAGTGPDQPAQKGVDVYAKVVSGAINAEPDLFWTAKWNQSGTLEESKKVFNGIDADVKGQIIGGIEKLDQLQKINAITSGFIPILRSELNGIGPYLQTATLSVKQLSSIGGNVELMRFLKVAQPEAHANIVTQIDANSKKPINDADMQKLLKQRHFTGEDRSVGKFMAEILQNYNPRYESLVNWSMNLDAFLVALRYMPNTQFEKVLLKPEIPVEFLNKNKDTLNELYKKFGKKKVNKIIKEK